MAQSWAKRLCLVTMIFIAMKKQLTNANVHILYGHREVLTLRLWSPQSSPCEMCKGLPALEFNPIYSSYSIWTTILYCIST